MAITRECAIIMPSALPQTIKPPIEGKERRDNGVGHHGRRLGQRLTYACMARRKRIGRTPASEYRSEEHTSELQSLMRISYAVFCLKKKKTQINKTNRAENNIQTTTQKRL